MKAVMLSIQPKWCELIANGKKTVEVRKTRPKLETPFKVYIYCTANKNGVKDLLEIHGNDGKIRKANGKIIGEFVCSNIAKGTSQLGSCLTMQEIAKYANNKEVYGWCISDLVIYDKPKELSEFYKEDFEEILSNWEDLFSIGVPSGCIVQYPPEPKKEDYIVKRPPQSWCYVEELR